jgi:hypothetical protein
MYVYCCYSECREPFEPTEDSAAYCSWECAERAVNAEDADSGSYDFEGASWDGEM